MTQKSHFSSQRSALILGIGVVTSIITFAGISFATSLNIPTNLENAFITIKNIIVSPSGTEQNPDSPNARILLDNNGNITTKNNGAGNGGNLTIGGEVRLKHSDFSGAGCNSATGCILRVTTDGKVAVTNNVNPWLGQDEQSSVFRRTSASQPNNIFLSTSDGNGAIVGKQPAQTYLRVGATMDPTALPDKPDTAIVAAGSIESRGDVMIRKLNGTQFGNEGNNKKTDLTNIRDYTELNFNVSDGKISIQSQYLNGTQTKQPTSFMFSANNSQTKVGVNTPAGQVPAYNLHVANQGEFFVGDKPTCPNNALCKFSQRQGALYANGETNQVGINTIAPNKTLDIHGTAAVTESLIIGHPSSFDSGADKLAVNGSTRANAYYYNSDRRYKSNIKVLTSPLQNLLKLTGYEYFNELSDKKDLGVIAQEVEAVYPELVQTDADGYKSVEYGNLVAPIIEAIKELSNKIDTLFKTYLSQQTKIDSLEARLQVLEAKIK